MNINILIENLLASITVGTKTMKTYESNTNDPRYFYAAGRVDEATKVLNALKQIIAANENQNSN